MLIKGTESDSVSACGETNGEVAKRLTSQYVPFPLLRTERLFQGTYHRLGAVDADTETDITIVNSLRRNEGRAQGIVASATVKR